MDRLRRGVEGDFLNAEHFNSTTRLAFYADLGGLPGAKLADYRNINCCNMWGDGSFRIPIARSGLVLVSGTWVSVQIDLGSPESDQWDWRTRTVQTGNPAVIQLPHRTHCTTWTPLTECFPENPAPADFMFAILGSEQTRVGPNKAVA